MFLKTQKNLLLLCAGIFTWNSVIAQTNELGFHISPAKLAPTQFDRDTSIVKGKSPFGASAGISVAHYFKSGFGLRSGFNFGFFSSKIVSRASAAERFDSYAYQDIYFYNSLNIEPVMRFNINNAHFEAFGGMELRLYYNSGSGGTGGGPISIYSYGTKNDIQSNAYGGISYIKNFENSRKLSAGLTKNVGFGGIAYGRLVAKRPDGSVYMSGFNSITNSLALKIQYSYGLRKSTRPVPIDDGKIRQAVFVEAFGSGGLYSVNYDRRFKPGNQGLGGRVGVGGGWLYSTDETEGARYVSFPILLNYIAGKGRSGFEAGIGLTTNVAPTKPIGDPKLLTYGVANLGYRLQPLKNGFMMRATWTPVFDKDGFYGEWAGLSFGYSFK